MTTSTSSLIIPALDSNDSAAKIAVGTTVPLSDGGSAIYVSAGSEIAQFNAVAINADNSVVNLTTGVITDTTGSSKQVGFAQTSIASGNYGWVQKGGRPKVKLATDCADQVPLYTTATPGVLDDAVVSIGLVVGVVSTVTISNATAITCIVPADAHINTYAVQA